MTTKPVAGARRRGVRRVAALAWMACGLLACTRAPPPDFEGTMRVGEVEVTNFASAKAGFVDDHGERSGGDEPGYLDLVVSPDPFDCERFRAHMRTGGPPPGSDFRGYTLLGFRRADASQPDRVFKPDAVPAVLLADDEAAPTAGLRFLAYPRVPGLPLAVTSVRTRAGTLRYERVERRPGGLVIGRVDAEGTAGPGQALRWSLKGRFRAEVCDTQGLVPPPQPSEPKPGAPDAVPSEQAPDSR